MGSLRQIVRCLAQPGTPGRRFRPVAAGLLIAQADAMRKAMLLLSILFGLTALARKPAAPGEVTHGGARIVPKFVNGKSVGFAFYSIRPGSKLAQGGLKNGDVIVRINGLSMDSPEKALDVYKTLRLGTAADVEVLRGSATLKLKLFFL